ncbi:MAG: hypothetical protein JRJ29_06905 [Deltaproteobacteria bacterium]|nr:hypothetical protein [Deltaproteobacteria bacterium]
MIPVDDIYGELRGRFYDLCKDRDLLHESVEIKARALGIREAIGNPEEDDFPIQKGKERLMQAEFKGGKGQAFTDRYGDYSGKLRDIIEMPLPNNFRRAIFVASINAVLSHLKKVQGTIHCKDQGPSLCAKDLALFLKERHGPIKITQVGFQPRFVELLAKTFEYRVLDLDPDNIGTVKFGVLVEGPDSTADAVAWADLLLVTGTTLVNGTIQDFLHIKPLLFYGTTIAGAAYLMDWDRFCAKST